ncbi:MAG: YcxB family protein [Campylobacter sp.]|uniref:YcxB family protein n=1 Tax=Campylobacter concisus TaxID=199 RepID=UPI000CD9A7D2|nr:YcxB family protein [Campylobacter concisus]MBF0916973.1 YcxB family protein [Campylobacter sp.]
MQNEKFRAKFSIKNDAKFKKLLREVSRTVYKKNKFVFLMRMIELPFAALCGVALVVLFDISGHELIVYSDMDDVSTLARNLAIVLCVGIVLLYIYAAVVKPVLFTRTIYSKIDVEREQEIVIYDDEVLFITKNSTVHFSYGAFLGTCETDDFIALILKEGSFLYIPKESLNEKAQEILEFLKERIG